MWMLAILALVALMLSPVLKQRKPAEDHFSSETIARIREAAGRTGRHLLVAASRQL